MLHLPVNLNLSPLVQQLLNQLLPFLTPPGTEIWLVGGTIRDLLEKRTPHDIDLAFAGDLSPQIRAWARQQKGSWFWLDKKRNQSRVSFGSAGLQFDFTPLRAATIQADLGLRDFTLNALAIPLAGLLNGSGELIDPLNGRKDLADGLLRSCGPGVISADPLRLLKGLRHHAQRGWQIEALTEQQMAANTQRLPDLAGERIRNELGQILASGRVLSTLERMSRLGILSQMFTDIDLAGLGPQLAAMTKRIDQLERVASYRQLLDQTLEEGLKRRAIIYLALLLRCVTDSVARKDSLVRLRCSKRSRVILQALCQTTVELERFLASTSPRVAALRLETLGSAAVEQLVFALLQRNDDDLDLELAQQIDCYQQALDGGRIADLLDGKAIIALSGLVAGRAIGDWQKRIKNAEISGEITNKAQAGSWLKEQLYD